MIGILTLTSMLHFRHVIPSKLYGCCFIITLSIVLDRSDMGLFHLAKWFSHRIGYRPLHDSDVMGDF